MAHLEKFKSVSCPNMLHHYRRDREATLERDNIDRSRTHLNYTLGPDGGLERIQERVGEVEATMTRSVRSDAVVMCDWVVTAPPDLKKEDERRFFESTYDFISKRYGEENMLGGYVHMDETTPHIHIALTPVVERGDGKLAFSAKDMFSRQELLRFHGELSDRIESDLGYRTQIEITSERTLERSLSRAGSLEEYQRSKDALERLRRDERRTLERNWELGGRAGELRDQVELRKEELRREESRGQELEKANSAREEKIGELSREVEQARERAGQLERSLELVKEKVREIAADLERFRDLAREQIGRIREFFAERFQDRSIERDVAEQKPAVTLEQVRGAYEDCAYARESYDESQEACEKLERDISDLRREIDVDQSRIAQLERDAAYEREQADRCQEKLEKLERHRLLNRSEIPGAKQELEYHRERQEQFEQQRDELKESLDGRTRELSAKEFTLEVEREVSQELHSELVEGHSIARDLYDQLEPELQHELEDTLEVGRDELRNTLWSRGLDLDERVYERALERMDDLARCSALYKHAEQTRSWEDFFRAERRFEKIHEEGRDTVTLRVERSVAADRCGVPLEREHSGYDRDFERGRSEDMGHDRGWDITDTFRGR